jgi:hypothetical protein
MNRRPRLTLAGLTAFIALCGVTFAAIRVSSPYWASAMVSLTTLFSDWFYVTFGALLPFSSPKAASLSRDVKVNKNAAVRDFFRMWRTDLHPCRTARPDRRIAIAPGQKTRLRLESN